MPWSRPFWRAESCKTGNRTIARRFVSKFKRGAGPVLLAAVFFCTAAINALGAAIENEVAVFAALDKVTARVSDKPLEVKLNETRRFGALKVTPRVCYSRPATETPKTTAFVEVVELMLDGRKKKLFTGWMFAESPGLNAVEHPVYDIWLTSCKSPIRATGVSPGAEAGSGDKPPRRLRRRKRRRIRR